jgi:hypothetical protein
MDKTEQELIELKPITREYALSLAEKGRSASPDVTRQMIGMLLRGDSLAAPDVVHRTEVKCEACEGTGLVTDDQFKISKAALESQILRELEEEGSSRTAEALESGSLSLCECSLCGGTGVLLS